MYTLFCAEKEKSRKADRKDRAGRVSDEKRKEKKKKKESKNFNLSDSPKPSSAFSNEYDIYPVGIALGEVVEVKPPQSDGELQTIAVKTKTTSGKKADEKKKKKRIKKRGLIVPGEKKNLVSDLAEEDSEDESTASLIEASSGKKDTVKQEVKKKQKRKRAKPDSEAEQSEPKKLKKSKSQTQEKGNSSLPLSDMEGEQSDLGLLESKSTKHSFPESGSGKDKRRGKEGPSKPAIFKPKKPKFGAVPVIGTKYDSVEHSPLISSSPQSTSSNVATKSKKPKFGITPPYSSSSSSQRSSPDMHVPSLEPSKDKRRVKEVSSKPKKPAFGVSAPKSSQQLAELAEELGEMMAVTEKESSAAEQLQIPVIKPQKTVPVFSKSVKKL